MATGKEKQVQNLSADHLWTVRQMAQYLGVSEWTVRQFIHEASFPGMIRLGKAIRLHPGITLDWLRERTAKG